MSLIHRAAAASIAALFVLLANGDPAGAASCERHGYKTVSRDTHAAVLERKLRGRDWEQGPVRLYACSSRFGRFVPLGSRGVSPDGPHEVVVWGINDRYSASALSWSDNSDGDWLGGAITVRDLKTGRRLYTTSSGDGTRQFFPATTVLGRTGDLGWIDDLGGVGDPKEVWLHRRGDRQPERIAASPDVNPAFLRWSSDGARLVWATRTATLEYTEHKRRESDPLHGGRCIRGGDRILGRGHGYVYVSRAFRSPGWARGRVLIACSLRFKRRVALAHSGAFNDITYTYEVPKVNQFFAASVQRQTDEASGVTRTLVMGYDLGREERICRADAAAGLGDVEVATTLLDDNGNIAWAATGRVANTGLSDPQVRLCEGDVARTLAAGPELDARLFGFGARNRFEIASEVRSGP